MVLVADGSQDIWVCLIEHIKDIAA
jgi:hypothetical protein